MFYGLSAGLIAQPLVVDAGTQTVTVCSGAQVTLGGNPTASGGTAPYTYSWAPPNGLDNANAADPICTSGSTITYTITVTDLMGSTATDSITVDVAPSPPSANASALEDSLCADGTIFLQADWIEGAIYQWLGPYGFNSSIEDPITGALEGAFEVTAYWGACAGPTSSVYITVLIPSVNAGNDTAICTNSQPFELAMGAPAGGIWSGPGVVGSSTFDPALADPANVLTYAWSDAFGCTNSDEVTVLVQVAPEVSFEADVATGCSPLTVTFNNQSSGQADAYEWIWGDGSTTLTNDSLVVHTFTSDSLILVNTVTLMATNACGSLAATTDVVVQPSTIAALFHADLAQGCAPLTVNFSQCSLGVNAWHWNIDGTEMGSEQNLAFTFTEPGTWVCSLVGSNACSSDSSSMEIMVVSAPVVDFEMAPASALVGSPVHFTDQTMNGGDLSWCFGDGGTSTLTDPEHTYLSEGSFNVALTVMDPLNVCSATLTRTLEVNTTDPGDEPAIWVPSAFTPDGDGVNELFIPVVLGYNTCGYEFEIFDRWGGQVFNMNEAGVGWDGRHNGRACPADVYTWRVMFNHCTDPAERAAEHAFLGQVTLLGRE